jgi:hypothetical protein
VSRFDRLLSKYTNSRKPQENLVIFGAVYATTVTVVLLVAVLPLLSVTVVEMVTVPEEVSTPDVKLLAV